MNVTLACAALVVALASCSAHSSIEKRLLGKWESIERQKDGSTTAIEIMFMADGTYSWGFPSKPRVVTGRWNVEGQNLIITAQTQAPDSGLPEVPPEATYRIVQVTAHECVLRNGLSEGRWTR